VQTYLSIALSAGTRTCLLDDTDFTHFRLDNCTAISVKLRQLQTSSLHNWTLFLTPLHGTARR